MIRQSLHTRILLLTTALIFFVAASYAQNNRTAREIALTFLQQQYGTLGLTQQDVADTRVTDEKYFFW